MSAYSLEIEDRRGPDAIRLAEEAVRTLLLYAGENLGREGLQETPKRVVKAFDEWFSGYSFSDEEVGEMLKAFEDGAELCGDEMVIVRDIEFSSHCEHHMAQFEGSATVAYIPDKKVVGLSKTARLVEIYSRRFQVQERLTNQIANAIDKHLKPMGVGVILNCRHSCMCSRGVKKQNSTTITSALRGAIKEQPQTRAEFLALLALTKP